MLCERVHTHHCAWVEVREQLLGVSSLLTQRVLGLNSGHWVFAASTCTHWALLLAPEGICFFLNWNWTEGIVFAMQSLCHWTMPAPFQRGAFNDGSALKFLQKKIPEYSGGTASPNPNSGIGCYWEKSGWISISIKRWRTTWPSVKYSASNTIHSAQWATSAQLLKTG